MRIRSGDLGVEAANREERAISARILLMATTVASLSLAYFLYTDAQENESPSPIIPATFEFSPVNLQD